MGRKYSSNPWSCNGDSLDGFSSPLSRKQILDRIRATLRGWPGLVTSLLDDESRHSRLIRTIAGYPQFESAGAGWQQGGPTPFDIPLEISSTRSFELTLSLDSFPSVKFSSSLWTEILEFEYKFGGHDSEKPASERLEIVLCLLFLGLGEPVSRKGGKIDLSRAAQSLLAEIFSYTNDGLRRWHKVVSRMRNPSIKWSHEESFNTRTVQFKRIKSWMREIIPGPSRNPGLSQTYLRGASALISAALGQRRGSNRNFSEVLVDGGGRIVTKSQDPRYPHGSSRPAVLESLYGVKGTIPLEERFGENGKKRFNFGQTTIPEHHLIEAISPLREEFSNLNADPKLRNSWGRFDDEIKWEVVVVQDLEAPDSIEDLLDNINNKASFLWKCFTIIDDDCPDHLKLEFPGTGIIYNRVTRRPRVVAPWDLECPRCNVDLEIKASERKELLDGDGNYCRGHRLLHLIGHEQRTRDSSLRQPSKSKENIDFPPVERQVISVARIDGNSIGWILNPKRLENSEIGFSDGIRRRSMRFNAHWWMSLSFALHQINEDDPDRVSCWVSAGDDIIIAEYGEKGSEIFSDGIERTISAFVASLNEGINRELSRNSQGPLASVSVGVSHRKMGGISEMVAEAEDLEAKAKSLWKKAVSEFESSREMISPEKLRNDSLEVNRMILDIEKGEFRFTPKHIESIAEKHSLSTEEREDLAKLQEICLRSEVVQQLDSLKILIPGKSGRRKMEDESSNVSLKSQFDPTKGSFSLVLSDRDSDSN